MLKRQILVVSGDLNICRFIKASVQDSSVEICYTSSVSETLDNLNKFNYSLALLDNQFPGISSAEMLRLMRRTKHIPILLFSDPLSADDKVILFQAGADAIIEGPFDISVCIAQAEALIQLYTAVETDRTQKDQIIVGNELTIIPRYRKVLVDGQPLSLTRKEFDLLHYFSRHPDQVLSRERLYTAIWCDSFAAASDETVRVHVQTLRKKLEAKGKCYIHNVWGIGYKFVPSNE